MGFTLSIVGESKALGQRTGKATAKTKEPKTCDFEIFVAENEMLIEEKTSKPRN